MEHSVKTARAKQQPLRNYFVTGFLLIGAIFILSAYPANVFAGLILGAELRLTYEDNVVGLLSDQQRGASSGGGTMTSMHAMGQPGGMGHPGGPPYLGSGSGTNKSPADFYATLAAEAGGYKDLGTDVSVFAKGFANHSSYDYYTDLDATIGGIGTGVVLSVTDKITAGATLAGKIKRFGESQRDSTAYEGTLSLKEKLLPSLWLREFGNYEKNDAEAAVFSYAGTRIGISAGYTPARRTLLTAGYNYLVEKYEEPSGFEIKSNTVFLGAEQTIGTGWSVAGSYDLQISKENFTGSSTTDNIFSVALRYSY
jgi:hypothetical protein